MLRVSCIRQCFNPHPRVEGDDVAEICDDISDVSIHTLAWRVTAGEQFDNPLKAFQSTPSRGG